jgi:hypothetical protein
MVLRQVAANFTLEQQRLKINEIGVDLDAINTTLATYNTTNWDTAYGWGNHASAGYLTSLGDAAGVTTTKISNWDTAYGWGDHSLEGYLTSETSHADVVIDGDFTSTGLMKRGSTAGSYSIVTDNSANWDTAYGWGDHADAGYLSVYVETDPTFTSSAAYGIDATDITNWDTAYGWGDHSLEGYLTIADFGTTAPVNANDAGTPGEIRYDANYIYVCVAANTWKRSALSTWP